MKILKKFYLFIELVSTLQFIIQGADKVLGYILQINLKKL